jgi:hypothetical protein
MHRSMILVVIVAASCHLTASNPISSMFGAIDVETPSYTVVTKRDKYEVRRYAPQLWAQVEYQVDPSADFSDKTSVGFESLFQYIVGRNQKQVKIPMTAPVIMQQSSTVSGRRHMAFIMPASRFTSLDQLPQPTNANVKLIAVTDPRLLACITFNMGLNSKRVAEREAELREATTADRVGLVNGIDAVRVGGYNPPWTLPWLRTNEICVPLVNQA